MVRAKQLPGLCTKALQSLQPMGEFQTILLESFFCSDRDVKNALERPGNSDVAPCSAALALGLVGGFNIVGTLLAGTVSDRLGRKKPLACIYLLRSIAFAVLLATEAPWTLYLHMGTLVGLIFTSHQVGGGTEHLPRRLVV